MQGGPPRGPGSQHCGPKSPRSVGGSQGSGDRRAGRQRRAHLEAGRWAEAVRGVSTGSPWTAATPPLKGAVLRPRVSGACVPRRGVRPCFGGGWTAGSSPRLRPGCRTRSPCGPWKAARRLVSRDGRPSRLRGHAVTPCLLTPRSPGRGRPGAGSLGAAPQGGVAACAACHRPRPGSAPHPAAGSPGASPRVLAPSSGSPCVRWGCGQ